MFACNLTNKYCKIYIAFRQKGNLLLKDGKEGKCMTQPELILRLVEMLLAERDKNNFLTKAEENKKDKD